MRIREQLSNGANSRCFASSPDFCHIFARQLKPFYRLAFLLTAHHSNAEQCTLASLDEALNANGIPKSSAEAWSKRTVIKNALEIARREVLENEIIPQQREGVEDEFAGWPFNGIISLRALERLVLVLSVLEKMTDTECSRLIGCAVSEIGPAKIRALETLSKFQSVEKQLSHQRHLSLLVLRGERAVVNLRKEASNTMARTMTAQTLAMKPEAPDARERI